MVGNSDNGIVLQGETKSMLVARCGCRARPLLRRTPAASDRSIATQVHHRRNFVGHLRATTTAREAQELVQACEVQGIQWRHHEETLNGTQQGWNRAPGCIRLHTHSCSTCIYVVKQKQSGASNQKPWYAKKRAWVGQDVRVALQHPVRGERPVLLAAVGVVVADERDRAGGPPAEEAARSLILVGEPAQLPLDRLLQDALLHRGRPQLRTCPDWIVAYSASGKAHL